MKKIMFSDKYRLTNTVLDGLKTLTRRSVKCPKKWKGIPVSGFRICRNALGDWFTYLVDEDEYIIEGSYLKPQYEIGEEVAIAQCYGDCGTWYFPVEEYGKEKGYTNKMFVKSEYMPHSIRITNYRIERLQDISDEDCLKEGIYTNMNPLYNKYTFFGAKKWFNTPQDAFASLINKISGKGTWESNPYVFVYEFELLR